MVMKNLSEPINMFIKRDPSKVSIEEVYNYTTAPGEKMVLHKIQTPGNIAFSIKVRDWAPAPPQNISNNTDMTTMDFTTLHETTEVSLITSTSGYNDTNTTGVPAPAMENTTFIVYIGVGRQPSETDADYNCTLPLQFDPLHPNDTKSRRAKFGFPDPYTCFISNIELNR